MLIQDIIPALSSNEIGPVLRVSISVKPVDEMEKSSTLSLFKMERRSEMPAPE